eukprot:CAMPEP_0197649896 /NCGR_PEP_ID=MMETSP1338-20131121/30136_1 /TAXON_ID=43686 ORGANISM="Pelagodinium beii, Strain RCC1491" /NCGR_SAMPLE_ID=MMETSP1338 /ASSEMBLY_ACC=CAM_ASM_000754 /LENGTH=142 /DNA_ID=CAMNT_0043224185 /DNA_START=65 /DNA_END=493 /DNA_ORIENTATION=-
MGCGASSAQHAKAHDFASVAPTRCPTEDLPSMDIPEVILCITEDNILEYAPLTSRLDEALFQDSQEFNSTVASPTQVQAPDLKQLQDFLELLQEETISGSLEQLQRKELCRRLGKIARKSRRLGRIARKSCAVDLGKSPEIQ